jgi:heat shock protein HslJ
MCDESTKFFDRRKEVLKVNSSEYTSKNWLIFLVSEIVIHLRLAVLLGGVFLLATCGPAAASLEGTEWVLVSLQGNSPLAGTHIWLVFEGEQARGSAGCNQYGGPYTVTGMGALTFQEFDITEQACLEPEGVMEQETVYIAALRMAVAYRLAGDRLEIQNSAGETVLAFER